MGKDKWTANWVEGDKTSPGIGLVNSITIPAESTLKIWFTHNGEEIKNTKGEPLTWKYENTKEAAKHVNWWFRWSHINGKSLTDLKYAAIHNDKVSSLAFAGFKDGISPIGEWLLSKDYAYVSVGPALYSKAMTIPMFETEETDLYAGLSLERLRSKEQQFSEHNIGDRYEVKNGWIVTGLDSNCCDASDFEGFYFGANLVRLDSKHCWSSEKPFNGIIAISSLVTAQSSKPFDLM